MERQNKNKKIKARNNDSSLKSREGALPVPHSKRRGGLGSFAQGVWGSISLYPTQPGRAFSIPLAEIEGGACSVDIANQHHHHDWFAEQCTTNSRQEEPDPFLVQGQTARSVTV